MPLYANGSPRGLLQDSKTKFEFIFTHIAKLQAKDLQKIYNKYIRTDFEDRMNWPYHNCILLHPDYELNKK